MNFKEGDRVVVKSTADTYYAGMHGVIVTNKHPRSPGSYPIGVHIDYSPDRCFEIDPEEDLELESKFLPRRGGTDLFHDAEYYVFECQWEGEQIAVSPAHGYEVKWGDRPESKWLYTPAQFMQMIFPGDGRS